MTGVHPGTPCRSPFKKSEIVPFHANTHLFMNLIVGKQDNFQTNPSNHIINTQNEHHLHRPNANLFYFQKCTFYAGIEIFNILLYSLTILKNEKAKFKAGLRKCLNTHSFYSVDGFFFV